MHTINQSLCYEIAIWKSAAAPSEVLSAVSAVKMWLQSQPGFISHTFLVDEQAASYVDIVTWASEAQAKQAMESSMSAPELGALLRVIEPSSVVMRHAKAP